MENEFSGRELDEIIETSLMFDCQIMLINKTFTKIILKKTNSLFMAGYVRNYFLAGSSCQATNGDVTGCYIQKNKNKKKQSLELEAGTSTVQTSERNKAIN